MSDAYLVAGVRTPFGRYGGALAAVRPDDLLAHVFREVLDASLLEASSIDDVVAGCVNQAGEDNRNVARMSSLIAGLPAEVPAMTINRLCGSGLDAVAHAARLVRAGEANVVLAGGVDSMSRAPYVINKPSKAWDRSPEIADTTIGWRFANPVIEASYGTDSMPATAQHVAAEFDISRRDQDAFAYRSQTRFAEADQQKFFAGEIAPVATPAGTISRDEHPRTTSLDRLASLSAVVPGGNITAGNSAGINDGAAAVIVASRAAVEEHGLRPLACIRGFRAAGVEPRIMGIGPVPATRKLLNSAGLDVTDIDAFEINEAFAAQALACMRQLGLPDDSEHVNSHGGAIALGHPLGASGVRLALTLARTLHRNGLHRGVATMCVGVGQGVSMLLEAP